MPEKPLFGEIHVVVPKDPGDVGTDDQTQDSRKRDTRTSDGTLTFDLFLVLGIPSLNVG